MSVFFFFLSEEKEEGRATNGCSVFARGGLGTVVGGYARRFFLTSG